MPVIICRRDNGGGMREDSARVLFLSSRQVKGIFVFYFIALVICFSISCAIFFDGLLDAFNYFELSIIGSCSIACMGSSIYYIRKLYKLVLNGPLVTDRAGNQLKSLATLVYFVARPIFSMAFSLLVVIGLKSGLIVSGAAHSSLGQEFVQASMFFSFFVGFLSGRFIRRLESWGEDVVERISGGGASEN